jgi:putative protein-disulfide isomerase
VTKGSQGQGTARASEHQGRKSQGRLRYSPGFPAGPCVFPLKLYYVHDPMCSWCWAFRPGWMAIRARLPSVITPQRILGGLAADTREPMPETMRTYIQDTWRRIERAVPGTAFNFEFWNRCRPRRSTYPACRAVIAAIAQGPHFEEPMIEAIQQAYYLEAQNPSDDEILIALAQTIGLDRDRFARGLNDAATKADLLRQIEFSRSLGARGFPSLILEDSGGYRPISYDYIDPAMALAQLGL